MDSAKKYEKEMRLDTRAKWGAICGPLGQVVGGISGSIYMISTYTGAPELTVSIQQAKSAEIKITGKKIVVGE